MSNPTRYRISDLISESKLIVGDGYRAKNSELSDSGIPFARAGNISGGFNFADADRFPTNDLHKVGMKISRPGDVVFTSKGTVGRFAYVREDTPEFVYSPQLCFWRSTDDTVIDPGYMFYWMQGPEFYAQYRGVASQTDMADYVSLRDQRRMYISLPPIDAQRAIAYTLGTLDDKIELNRQMNRTLDEIARTLFSSWFVNFDPVQAKVEGRQPEGMDSETAALFPDRFVDSELGLIPEGWEVKALGNAFELNPRRVLSKGSTAPFLEMKNVATEGHRPLATSTKSVTGGARFQNGDTLLARITPCLENGKTAYVDFLDEDEIGFGSTEYIVIRPRSPLPATWAYIVARDETFRTFAIQNMTGTSGRQRVSANSIATYRIVVPPGCVASAFDELAQPWFRLVRANDEEIHTLAELRDTLLPELMSRRMSVPIAEKLVSEART